MVGVVIRNPGTASSSIVVKDDGEGMTLSTIRDIWLVPGHDHRERQRNEQRRTNKDRLPLGEKGLGRFAAHKLGNKIEVVTRACDQQECVVSINWSKLIQHTNLSDAKVQVRQREPKVFSGDATGTRLVISDLRSSWTRGEVRRLQRQITSITSPFAKRSDRFRTTLSVPDHPEWLDGVPDVKVLLRRAPWFFQFRFADGEIKWFYQFQGVPTVEIEKRQVRMIDQPLPVSPIDDEYRTRRRARNVIADKSITKGIGPIEGRFHVFDRDQIILAKLGDVNLIQAYLDQQGGMRVYRDGIRVYNYGEAGDDWLGLDIRRVNRPTLHVSQNIVVGAIDLSLAASGGLKEKTNREGFVENENYENLKRVILGALTQFEAERKKDKEKLRVLTTPGRTSKTDQIKGPLERLRKAVRRHLPTEEIEPLIDRVERDYNELKSTMLRAGQSNVGIALVFHEVEQGVRGLCEIIEAGGKRTAIGVRARELQGILSGFTDLLRKGNKRRNSLNHLIQRVRDINRVRLRKHRVRLACPALKDDVIEVQSEFVFNLALGALNNLVDNALYWLKVRWPETGRARGRALYIDISLDLADGPAIVVADTGPGLTDAPSDLTMPFFTRRPEGMGLGLYYANLVMEFGGGQLAFPESGDANIPDEFDGAVVALIFPPSSEEYDT